MKVLTINNTRFNYIGCLDLLDKPCVSVSGSRKIDNSSSRWLRNKLRKCTTNSPIVSGLAIGTDEIAHRYAIEHNIPTIAVLPSGLQNIYPKQNRQLALDIVNNGGLLLSQYDDKTPANRDRFIERNQIIAMLGFCLIVPQFNIKSGTRHTVDFARDLNKKIYIRDSGYSGNRFIIDSPEYKTIII